MKFVLKEIYYQLRFSIPVWFFTLLTALLPDIGFIMRGRGLLISIFMPGRPKGLSVGRDVTFLSIDKIEIGRDVYIAKGTWINGIGRLKIMDEVVIAPYVVMSSNNHGFKNNSVRFGGGHPAPIIIGKGTWLAAHVVIAAGVRVGDGNIVAANSVVTKNTEDNAIVAGVPARFISVRLDNPSEIKSKHQVK